MNFYMEQPNTILHKAIRWVQPMQNPTQEIQESPFECYSHLAHYLRKVNRALLAPKNWHSTHSTSV